MFELYKAECGRFRWLALGVAIVHAGVLLFLDRVLDALQQSLMVYQMVGAIYAIAGALLGLYQAGSYARMNQWIALVHRPLSPHRILISIAGGSATMLTAAVLLPLVLLLLSHGLTGARFVDSRHGLLILSGSLLALTGLMAGFYAALAPRRYGWLAILPALLPTVSMAVGWAALMVQCGVLAALTLLVASAFKPDLAASPRPASSLAVNALAVAMGAYLLIVIAGDLVFQTAWIATGTHPLNSAPPRGGVVEAMRSEGGPLMEAGLAGLRGDQARVWREHIRLSEVFALPPAIKWLPVRGELTNVAPMQFDDMRRGVRWTFSHDDMRFHGVRLSDGVEADTLSARGGFAAPPLAIGDGRMIAANSLFVFDIDDGALHRRIRLPAGEAVVAEPAIAGSVLAIMSNRYLRLYDARVLDDGQAIYPQLAAIPLSAPVGSLMRIDMIELLDGYLISFTYARGGADGPAKAWQEILVVDGAGRSRPVARRILHPDFPLAARFLPYWTSPALKLLRDTAEKAGGGYVPFDAREPVQVPRSVWLATALLALVSGLGTILFARKWRIGWRERGIWTLATLALGLPMLLAFWLIRPVRKA